jgi:outer membrane protein assembly factor BamD
MSPKTALTILPLLFANAAQSGDETTLASKPFIAIAQRTPNDATIDDVARSMMVGRYYLTKQNHVAAISRFKVVATQFQSSPYVEEALAHIAESYLALGIHPGAQAAVAVLERKFPAGRWTAAAYDALKAAGLEPADDDSSWISRAFQ